jgi:hypothetical protein
MDVSRRHLFPAVLTEIRVAIAEGNGIKGFRLTDLEHAPDDTLRAIIPARVAGPHVSINKCMVLACDASGVELSLFPAEQDHLDVFNSFNGRQDLGAIAEGLASRSGLMYDEAFGAVRALFLHLLKAGVVVPANPLGE